VARFGFACKQRQDEHDYESEHVQQAMPNGRDQFPEWAPLSIRGLLTLSHWLTCAPFILAAAALTAVTLRSPENQSQSIRSPGRINHRRSRQRLRRSLTSGALERDPCFLNAHYFPVDGTEQWFTRFEFRAFEFALDTQLLTALRTMGFELPR
jgi:hypothetical protein